MPRPSPDELLRRLQTREGARLKIFLGYASRSGKSIRMFDEGRRRRSRGQDVVIGAVQAKGSEELESIIAEFEAIALKDGDLDLERILARRPQVCLVDELGKNNRPSARHAHRWEDVEELRCAGINVVTAVNLQFISPESVPESFIHSADELVLVDAPSGDNDLRERALLLAAQVVEEQLERYMDAHGITQSWGTQERILICITPRSNTKAMLESGARVAALFHGHLLALHVATCAVDDAVEANLEVARKLGAEVHVVRGSDPIKEILEFAREQRVTQIFMGHTQQATWKFWKPTPVSRLIRDAEGMDVRLFPQAAAPA